MTASYFISTLQVGDLIILPGGGAERVPAADVRDRRPGEVRKMRKLLRSLIAVKKQAQDKD